MTRLRSLRERLPARPASSRPAPPPAPPMDGASTPGRGVGERLSGLVHRVRLHAAGAGASISHRWQGIPRIARQRIAAAAIVAVLVALVAWVLIPAAPCGVPGGSTCPATDEAITLVPADAFAYVHIDIDADGEQARAASAFGSRLPLLSGLLLGSVSEIGGERIDLRTQVRPWAGNEIAVAILPGPPSLGTVTMIEAEDAAAARGFADRLIGAARTDDVGGIPITVGDHGEAAALIDGFLLVGDEASVGRMIEGGGGLGSAAAAAGIGELPADRFAYAYLSGAGARSLFGPDAGFSGLDPFVNSRAAGAVTAALSFEGGLASLTIRSEQDPALATAHPSLLSALPKFVPQLDTEVGPDALAYLGLSDPAAAESLLDRARRSAPALAAAYEQASDDLRASGGVSIGDDLLPLLDGEVALAVEPVAAQGADAVPGVLVPSGVPYASLIADGIDGEAAGSDLAKLRGRLAGALAPGAAFKPLQIAGVEAQTLAISSNVDLTYATYGDRLVVATKPVGIAQARAGGAGLADSTAYRAVTTGMPADVSLISYLDLRDLLSLGEQVGLATDPGYAQLAPDLRSLQAAALAVDDSGAEIRTDLNVSLGEPEAPLGE